MPHKIINYTNVWFIEKKVIILLQDKLNNKNQLTTNISVLVKKKTKKLYKFTNIFIISNFKLQTLLINLRKKQIKREIFFS